MIKIVPSMRNAKTKKINQLILDFLNQKRGVDLKSLTPTQLWQRVMGKHILAETRKVYIESNILYVLIKNPYVKSDLSVQKTLILERIKKFNTSVLDIVIK